VGLKLGAWPDHYAVWQLEAFSLIPAWAQGEGFPGISCSEHELSMVFHLNRVPPEIKAERGWRCFRLAGPSDSGLSGILAWLLNRLARARAGICVVWAYSTDYLLVKAHGPDREVAALEQAGHVVSCVVLCPEPPAPNHPQKGAI
jgi:hypothetical protein